ncbi:hypothetical protein HELRODRAFT_186060 [Helobdella robusta]|uniref:omega-amidase n=1 Tax=Helobdella robusta TaxID=6412 RepID=T1FNM0_HELRO|nr:hypothetical protein HELRODRAFT_186060 [Helobdella robusta]ESN93857.1 hypothetical protein HELRODRAFT_186060 [Helobdella robusta]
MAAQKLRLALIQFTVGSDKAANLNKICSLVKQTCLDHKPNIVALPECCNSPFGHEYFNEYAESIVDGPSVKMFSSVAKENKIFLVAGSVPEKGNDGKLFNTTTVFNPDGNHISTFRKVHLFDIDVKGKFSFQESKTLTAGDSLATFSAYGWKIGLGICYDIRFAEMAQLYSRAGCKLLIYPAAFSMATGPYHWEILTRGRALDNQCYVAAVSPSRCLTASFVAYGHSIVVNPWGEIVTKADETDKTIVADIDLNYLEEVRETIPISKQKKTEVFEKFQKEI